MYFASIHIQNPGNSDISDFSDIFSDDSAGIIGKPDLPELSELSEILSELSELPELPEFPEFWIMVFASVLLDIWPKGGIKVIHLNMLSATGRTWLPVRSLCPPPVKVARNKFARSV